jgi:hypothetical protein
VAGSAAGELVSTPDFSSVFFKLDILGASALALPAIATITMTDPRLAVDVHRRVASGWSR